jgi:hypothetical protein
MEINIYTYMAGCLRQRDLLNNLKDIEGCLTVHLPHEIQ